MNRRTPAARSAALPPWLNMLRASSAIADAALFRTQAEHVERRRAAGDRQIEEAGDRRAVVGGG